MLVVVASGRDSVAAAAVRQWGTARARVLHCGDLSTEGWRYEPGAGQHGVAVIGGEQVPVSDIEGVLVRLPYVPEDELPHIVAGDRSYVAQEMTAFLTAWLSELTCPVVNRPTAVCLGGPGWSTEQWQLVGARLGLGVGPVRHGSNAECVTVIGRRTFGSAHPAAIEQSLRLAHAADVDLLEVQFCRSRSGLRMVGVNTWPDVSPPARADALREHLLAS